MVGPLGGICPAISTHLSGEGRGLNHYDVAARVGAGHLASLWLPSSPVALKLQGPPVMN